MKHIKLFETYLGSTHAEINIGPGKYGFDVLYDPIVPDGVTLMKSNKNSKKFEDRESFIRFLKEQKYFSASYSRCFQDITDLREDREDKESIMLFETGHELVAIWDDKQKVGYILPADLTRN